ncbi:MAG: 4'-phosphopantetheinyl transferase superfamily protein [Bacteroidia bacterium]|nr:4'-phosphopantetheinyl transferase superfamily protein [Bacteroidia bacterium]
MNTLLSSGARAWVWHLTETAGDLQKFVPAQDFQAICQAYTHERRRLQKLAIRTLLMELGDGQALDLLYDEAGKPQPKDFPGFLSISHSAHHVGLVYHPLHAVGLDLEEPDGRALKIAERFLNPLEKTWIRQEEAVRDCTLVWSVKEALFKNIGGGGILFKEHLWVHAPRFSDGISGKGEAEYRGKKQNLFFDYHVLYLEGVLLVHTIAKQTGRFDQP